MRNEEYEKTRFIISKEDYPKWNVSLALTVWTVIVTLVSEYPFRSLGIRFLSFQSV